LKVRVLLVVLGVAVVAVYGVLAIMMVGLPGGVTTLKAGFTAKDAYPQALQEAQTWQPDADLVSASASWREVTAEQLLEEDASWGFTFFSAQTRQIRVVAVNREGAKGAENVDVPPTVRTVDTASWQLDSPEVLRLFLDHGGRDFLAQHPGATVSLRLGLEEGGERLVWHAFGIYSTDRSTITLSVDANSGDVIGTAG